MARETELSVLLAALAPTVAASPYVFVQTDDAFRPAFEVAAMVQEAEGTTLVVEQSVADEHELAYDAVFARISLGVVSSLEAVGLTARVATALAQAGIACNVIAGFSHDHLFVPEARKEDAVHVLRDLSDEASWH